ncbi:helix-turn-helix domain-containing protein [Muricauda sp. HICW]|uniref:Helix-turn-helix domain-containing protein n=1 Tax=Flagellimonas chongwuensis TaxID=2697365 RepID=A0A850NGV7_9FLAO|nr:helix-turn-helix transcriptional regulator [Allomuricauda chongwuensis]NVN18150.1 helix-turn-helix domain-containing protein [Allomuricauda chongwuensis]
MNKEIISRIERVIEHLELSVSAFADAIGVQRSSMSHLLNGRNKPSLDFVLKLVDTYPEVKLDWLLKGKGNFPETDNIEEELVANKADLEIENLKTGPIRRESVTGQEHNKEPYKIVMFYSDGTFDTFNAKKD